MSAEHRYTGRQAAVFLSCCLLYICNFYIVSTAPMTYTSILCEDLHFIRSEYMLFSIFRCISSFTVSLCMTRLTNRFRIHTLLPVGIFAYVIMFLGMSRATTLPHFYLAGFIGGIGIGIISVSTLSLIIQKSFDRSINSIQGIVFSSSGLFGIFFNPVLSQVVDRSGWRSGFTLLMIWVVIFGITACILLAAFFRQDRSSAHRRTDSGDINTAPSRENLSRHEKIEAGHILLIAAFTGMGAGIVYVNAAPILISFGYDTVYATGIAASILSLANLFGKIFFGRLFDRFDVKAMQLVTYSLFGSTVLLCTLLSSRSLVCSVIVLFAIALSIASSTVGHPALTSSIFTGTKRKNILFYATSVQLIGSALGSTLFQMGYSVQNGYLFSLVYEGILALLCIALVWNLYRIHESSEQKSLRECTAEAL